MDSLQKAMGKQPANGNKDARQLGFFGAGDAIVHYYDKDGALRSGRLLRKIKKGKKRGAFVVADTFGKAFVPPKIRNIEYPSKTRTGS
jgi:hypothetical protein